jgi:hypothetical protein
MKKFLNKSLKVSVSYYPPTMNDDYKGKGQQDDEFTEPLITPDDPSIWPSGGMVTNTNLSISQHENKLRADPPPQNPIKIDAPPSPDLQM